MQYNEDVKPVSTTTSSFEMFIENGLVYVDKTKAAYDLLSADQGVPFFFLARPRRWGKTLLVSTLEAALKGRRELFDGLYLGMSDYGFRPRPVLRFDMSMITVSDPIEETSRFITYIISSEAEKYGVDITSTTPANALQEALRKIHERTGEKVAVLIDEYDCPLLDSLYSSNKVAVQDLVKGIYARLKPCADSIGFLFITGVARMNNQSIFSKLNNLKDLTFSPAFASALGFTQRELEHYYSEGIDECAAKHGWTREKVIAELGRWYDGYCFASGSEGVYNPISINAFFDGWEGMMRFNSYWAATASSSMLVDLARRTPFTFVSGEVKVINEGVLRNFMIEDFAADARLSEDQVYGYLYMTGYLTLDHQEGRDVYLRVPNYEIELVICEVLSRLYVEENDARIGSVIRKAIMSGDINTFAAELKELVLLPPYDSRIPLERYYQSLIYVVLRQIDGLDVRCEEHTARGRADLVISYKDRLIIIELKLNGSSEEAMAQIMDRRYWEGYSGKEVFLIGMNIDTSSLSVTWKIQRLVER